jgi:hypothetical protein
MVRRRAAEEAQEASGASHPDVSDGTLPPRLQPGDAQRASMIGAPSFEESIVRNLMWGTDFPE